MLNLLSQNDDNLLLEYLIALLVLSFHKTLS